MTRFDRSANGVLSHQGCITSDQDVSPSGMTSPSGCLGLATTTSDPANTGLDFLHSIMVSPDGDSVYAVARDDAAVIRLNREDDPPDTVIGRRSRRARPYDIESDVRVLVERAELASSHAPSTAQAFAACGGVASGSVYHASARGWGPRLQRSRRRRLRRPRREPSHAQLRDRHPGSRHPLQRQARAKVKTKKPRARLTLAFTSTEPGSSFECAVGSAPFAPCTSPFVTQLKAKKGKGKRHTIQVRAVDALGNRDASAASLSVKAIRK